MVLLEELFEEVLLRLPPSDPASLVHAVLVCKPWCRLVSGRRFRRRLHELHGSQPMLGFLCNLIEEDGDGYLHDIARFVPTSPCFRPRRADHRGWHARDARHGRVLLVDQASPYGYDLAVWDPITDEWQEIPRVREVRDPLNCNVAVLSADRDDCHFLVVSVCSNCEHISLQIYSSETGSWSEPANVAAASEYKVDDEPAAASEYDECLTVLMATEDSGMRVARSKGAQLTLWSMETSPSGDDVGWVIIRVIELDKLLHVSASSMSSNLVGFAAGTSVLFVDTGDELFTLDVESDQVKMVLKGKSGISVVPYMTFCIPALGSVTTDEGPELDDSIV
ncbi:unnamed protein product [Urochloa decumbens]|uniref:F-box domain-containing protein n=1 Tax=Urochloa decumbens TaxID=240449 RepID=A0ABC9FPU4_9POAL